MNAFKRSFFTLLLGLAAPALWAQSASATYTSGNLDVEGILVSGQSSCSDTLTVTIPAGSWVLSTDVTYTMTQNLGATSLQVSFLECTSTGNSETSLTNGPTAPVTNPFPVVYNRTGLGIANGPSPTGQVKFYLHAMRQGFATCSNFVTFVPNNSWTVTVHYGPAPACPPPFGLTSPAQGPGSVSLSWSGTASSFDIEYGFAGFPQGTGTVVNTTANALTINGLTPLAPYHFYVRANCAPGLSAWTGPFLAIPQCLPVAVPYVQTFESGFTPPVTTGGTGVLDPCFGRNVSQNYFWDVGPPVFSNFSTGPAGDHTTGSGKYLYTNPQNTFNTNTAAWVQTPYLDLGGITSPELVYWYHMFGTGISSLQVQVVKNGVVSTVSTVTGQQQTSKTASWKRGVVDLAAYAGDTVQIRFVGNRVTGFNTACQIAIDDLSVDQKSTCTTVPTNLSASNVTSTSVQLSWTSAATNWMVRYYPQNSGPGAAQFAAAGTNPFVLNGLTPSTTYVFEVADSCGTGSTGLWSLPVNATTLCGPIPAPYFENFSGNEWVVPQFFNDTGVVNLCWKRSNTTQYFWRPGLPSSTPSALTGPNSDHTTGNGKFLFTRSVGFFGNTTTQTSISSAFIDLAPLDTPELRFWYHMFGANIDELDVLIRVGTATPVPVLNLSGQQQGTKAAAWNEAVVDLTPFMDDTIRIVFRARRLNATQPAEIAIDDILIQEKPDCPKPTTFQNTWVGANGAAFNWTDPGGTSWVIEYGPPGFTPGTGTQVTVTNPTDTIFGLTAGTTYDFYISRVCGGSFNWRGPRQVTTLPCNDAWFYTLDMTSQFFNGWQGTIVRLSSGTYFKDYTLTSNLPQTISFPVCNGQPVSLSVPTVSTTSTFAVGFVFKSDQGTTLYTHTAGNTLNTGILFTMVGACGGLCEPPSNLSLVTVTGTSATISWASTGNTWVEYGPVGFAPGTGTLVPGPSTSPLTINGLTQNTTYQVYIQDSCATPPVSQRVGPLSFTTLNCVPVTATAALTTTNLTVAASATTSPAIDSYTWNFGDGTVLTGATANHTYAADGVYTVKLVVVNPCGGADSTSQTITVCNALGAASLTTNSAGLSVGFVGSVASGTPTQYFWNFGDNSSGSGTTPNHVYALDGTYTITLTVVNLCGDSSTTSTTLQVCAPVQGQFTLNQIQSNITVDAWATPGAAGLNFTWDFGDGGTASGPVASHGYTAAGTYTVTMTATNQCGESYTFTKVVKVCTPPVVAFTFKIISTSGNGMLVEFDASASQGGNGYLWNFGDGNTSTVGPIVQHLYVTPGLFYVVKLSLMDTCGTMVSDTKALSSLGVESAVAAHVVVYPNPTAGHELFVNGLEAPLEGLRIITLQGVVIQAPFRQDGSSLAIDLRGLAPGTYILELETAEGIIRKRFIRSAP